MLSFKSMLNSAIFFISEDNRNLLLFYLIAATVVIVIIVSLLALSTRDVRRLNWYEQNVLDLSRTKTNYVQRKTFQRCDTDEDREIVAYELPRHRQSRIKRDRKEASIESVTSCDLTNSFTIPRAQKNKQSMFTNPHHSQFDRGLYQCSSARGESESYCEGDSLGSEGSIHLSLWFDPNLSLLTVNIKSATDVPSKRQDGNPNPYFRISLEVPESTEPKVEQQTTVYKNTTSPVINEEFYFQTPAFPNFMQPSAIATPFPSTALPLHSPSVYNANQFPNIPNPLPAQVSNNNQPAVASSCLQSPAVSNFLQNCRLEIMVYDYDQFSVDECVGYCWLTLGRLQGPVTSDKENPTTFHAELLPFDENGGKGFGEVLFSLTYLSKAQRLMMNVFKARNLLVRHPDASGGYFNIRVTLLDNSEKRLKRKKTSSKRNAKSCQFNESLNFTVPKNALCDSILEIEAVHEYGTFGMGSDVLGKIELPLHKCKELWRAIIREEKSQARWYSLEEP